MTKQIATSSGSGSSASANSELGVDSFDRLLKGFQSQLTGFSTVDTVLIGNCPQNVTEEEINKFFCGFATIVKLQRIVFKSLTTNIFIAKFDSSESASRSKVLNTLALNGKKILLLQPDEKQFFDKKHVVELNGLQEHSEEVIYDHMSTFGNVSFVLKTNSVTYIVFEELSAVESSCRCDYLDQYPVTIRSVLDCAAACVSGSSTSIETCILEQIDQNSGLLADEEEGQINNFMQLLDMENLDEYLEQDEKEKNAASDKPLLDVGNEEIIVTEDEAVQSEGEKEADVAAIEKQALQLDPVQRKQTAGTVLVDNRAKSILKLTSNLLTLTDLPQLNVAVKRVPNKVKIGPKKGILSSKQKKKKSMAMDSHVSKNILGESSDHLMKKEKKKASKETVHDKQENKSGLKSDKDKSKKKQPKKVNPEQKQTKPAESAIKVNKSGAKTEACEKKSSDKKKDDEHEASANVVHQKHHQGKKNKESKKVHEIHELKASDSKPELSESTSEKHEADEKVKDISTHQKCELLHGKKSVFVLLTKLTSSQIQTLSQVRRTETSQSTVDTSDEKNAVPKRKPGPAKGALRENLVTVEKEVIKLKKKHAAKRGLSDDEMEPPACVVATDESIPAVAAPTEQLIETDSTHTMKKLKLDTSPEKNNLSDVEKTIPEEHVIDEDKSMSSEGLKAQDDSEHNTSNVLQSTDVEPNSIPQTTVDEPTVLPEGSTEGVEHELQDKNSDSVPDVSNMVEISQIEPAANLDSDEERPLVMDISFDVTEEIIGKQSLEAETPTRKVVSLDSKSAALLKGKTHDGHLLYLDVLPRAAVKIRHIIASDYNVIRPKEHHKSSSGHHDKHAPKKVSFDLSAGRRKEDKPEKPRKTNLDKIDSKFLPAGSKLKSKVKSKTEINHKKHLPVPELPIELKTHLNTSFKIPKKNSSVKAQSIARNASELNCLHKEQDERNKHRKRFQKERRPRDGPGGRDRMQKRPESSNVRQQREPSPIPDFFDPSFGDHSPSPQRMPPTPPPVAEAPTAAPPRTAQIDGNQRSAAKPRGGNKPTFQDIWNIPEKKPEVWANPPWVSGAVGSATIGAGDTWDSAPVRPHNEQNINKRPNINRDTRRSRSPVARAPQSRNTIDSGESWSPGGAVRQNNNERQQPPQTIHDGESWTPNQPISKLRQDRQLPPQLSARRSRSPNPAQLSKTISGGDMWDLNDTPTSARKMPSPNRNAQQNPLLSGEVWANDGDVLKNPTGVASSAQFDRRPSIEERSLQRMSSMQRSTDRRRRSRSPFRQRRSRSRSPGRRRRSADRTLPIRGNRSAEQSPDRWNIGRSQNRNQRSQSPMARLQNFDRRGKRPLDRRNFDRDLSPFGRRRRSRSGSPVRRRDSFDRSPLRGSPSRMPFRQERSCSPRPWDVGTSRTLIPPRQNLAEHTLLSGGVWDNDIVPLRDFSPPRLRESLLDDRRRYALDRLSPNDRRRSDSRDRFFPLQRNQSFDRSPQREGSNNRWNQNRSPNRRIRSLSRSPDERHRSMGGDRSPSYQRMLDYWKEVEDRERDVDRQHVDMFNKFGQSQSPEPWLPRANDGDFAGRNIPRHIDSDMDREGIDEYSPSRALEAISSDDECDFTNPRHGAKTTRSSPLPDLEPLETIPLKIPTRDQPPARLANLSLAATSPIVRDEGAGNSMDSFPSFKGDNAAYEKEFAPTTKQWMDDASSSHSQTGAGDKRSALEHLKQRAERLKKLDEMKNARQKLLTQIKHNHFPRNSQQSESEIGKPSMLQYGQLWEKSDNNNQRQPEPVSNRQALVAAATVPVPASALPTNVDCLFNQPILPAPGIPVPLPQMSLIPMCPPPLFGMAPLVPPLPSDLAAPPPPNEPRPPEPVKFIDTLIPPPSNAWILPLPSFAPVNHIDVSKPPPNLAKPLLNVMPSPQHDTGGERPKSFPDAKTFKPQIPPSNLFDKSRHSQPNRGPNPKMSPENHSFERMPSEENDFFNVGMSNFDEPNNQQHNRDPRQQQQQQNRFGGNRQFMRQQQQQQQPQQLQQKRDPRQNHDGNVYGGGQFNRNNNPDNNFNNPGNSFNNNDPRNNFNNNNPRNNFNNNNPRNNFNNNDPRNNPGNNFRNNNPGNNFNNMNLEDELNAGDTGNNFRNNNPGNFFNSNLGVRGGGRGRFNNNQRQQRFNFQLQNRNQQPFNNNRNNNNQQQQQQLLFLLQQQEMFEEGCFDMNEVGDEDGDANNWDDLME